MINRQNIKENSLIVMHQIIFLGFNEGTYSIIFINNNFGYHLSDSEKNNKGVHIRLKISIFNKQKKQVSNLE